MAPASAASMGAGWKGWPCQSAKAVPAATGEMEMVRVFGRMANHHSRIPVGGESSGGGKGMVPARLKVDNYKRSIRSGGYLQMQIVGGI